MIFSFFRESPLSIFRVNHLKVRVIRIEGKMNWAVFKRSKNDGPKSECSYAPDDKAETPAFTEAGNEKPHRRLCAWCGLVMQQGMEPVSHGICRDCVDFISGEFQVAEDSLDPFCEVCSGPYDEQKCSQCTIDSSRGGMSIGKTILEGNHQE